MCRASRLEKAVASSGTRDTAPPSVKIGIVENGEVIFSDCRMRVSIISSDNGGKAQDFQ